MSAKTLPPGTVLDGKYKVARVLGGGGFGITYRSLDTLLDRQVAIKEFFPDGSRRVGLSVVAGAGGESQFETLKLAFLRESRILSRLEHPGIVRVHTIFLENNSAYLVMENVEGQNLAFLLLASQTLQRCLDLINSIGNAVEAIHQGGFVHRDIKPSNVIVAQGDYPILLDFGLAGAIEPQQGLATRPLSPSVTSGSPGYAPPEQYDNRARLLPNSDIYSISATLYHLLTGIAPPSAPARAAGQAILWPSSSDQNIPGELRAAILRALSLDRAARPQSVTEFLKSILSACTVVPSPSVVPDQVDVLLDAGQVCTDCGLRLGARAVVCSHCGSWQQNSSLSPKIRQVPVPTSLPDWISASSISPLSSGPDPKSQTEAAWWDSKDSSD